MNYLDHQIGNIESVLVFLQLRGIQRKGSDLLYALFVEGFVPLEDRTVIVW